MIVVDASVTLAWCFDDEASPAADAILERVVEEGAIAPAHWPLEVANGLRTAERRQHVEAGSLPQLRDLLARLPVEIQPVGLAVATGPVLDAALAHNLSAYDAAYLLLAVERQLPLATVDARLRKACAAAGVALAD